MMVNNINKWGLLPLFLWFSSLFGADYSIVFVYIGQTIPEYTVYSLNQARLFNPDCPIYLIGNESALKNFPLPATIEAVTCESLPPSPDHNRFTKNSYAMSKKWRNGFFFYTSERFLYLSDFIKQKNLKNVFHLENDVLLYADLNELLPVFENHYSGIGATFDNDERCIPGFFYVRDQKSISELGATFANLCKQHINDMQIIAHFFYSHPDSLKLLPVAPSNYPLSSAHPKSYSNHLDQFNSLFDAAAFGQYLGGDDPRNNNAGPGFINEASLYNPSHFDIDFLPDSQNRRVPFVTYQGKTYRMNNLHIHCKDLKQFISY